MFLNLLDCISMALAVWNPHKCPATVASTNPKPPPVTGNSTTLSAWSRNRFSPSAQNTRGFPEWALNIATSLAVS